MAERRHRQKGNEVEAGFVQLFQRLNPTLIDQPELTQALAKQFTRFVDIWGKNHPHNPVAVDRAQARLERWLDRNY